jgi:hypothetical protein
MLLDIFPKLSRFYSRDRRLIDSKLFGDLTLGCRRVFDPTSIGFFQFFRMAWTSSLSGCVPHIVKLSAKKEVLDSDTGRDIAGVQHSHSLRDWSVGKNPSESMGGLLSSMFDPAVSVQGAWSSPEPASISFLNLCPKAALKSFPLH